MAMKAKTNKAIEREIKSALVVSRSTFVLAGPAPSGTLEGVGNVGCLASQL
jgi:hypothetical protein